MFYLDPLYFILVGPAILLTLWAQVKVKGTFSRYSRLPSASGITGARVARLILDRSGLQGVPVEETQGWLSDHYDPLNKVLRLSPNVFRDSSLASIGVAAHEAGHAVQHAHGYAPMILRQTLAPAAMFGSNIAIFLLFLGMIINAFGLIKLGILAFSLAVLFQVITLPVEFNASRRAKALVTQYGIVTTSELDGVKRVLNAAAMTYVAAAVAALSQLLYFLIRFGLIRGSDE
jgi:hypothetical protein